MQSKSRMAVSKLIKLDMNSLPVITGDEKEWNQSKKVVKKEFCKKNPRHKIGWNVQARFQIKLHEKDRALLLLIQNYLGNIGYISKINDRSTVEFRVSDITSLNNIIIPHFEKYTLITNKYKDFLDWEKIYYLMLSKEHLTELGREKIKILFLNMNSKRQFTK